METINKTSGTLISDIERHYKEICKERGIDPHAKAEPETAPIEQPTSNLTYYVAECMEFPNLGEYHDNLSLEEAVRIYQEDVYKRQEFYTYFGMKQLMAGAGVAVVGMVLVPLLSGLFSV